MGRFATPKRREFLAMPIHLTNLDATPGSHALVGGTTAVTEGCLSCPWSSPGTKKPALGGRGRGALRYQREKAQRLFGCIAARHTLTNSSKVILRPSRVARIGRKTSTMRAYIGARGACELVDTEPCRPVNWLRSLTR